MLQSVLNWSQGLGPETVAAPVPKEPAVVGYSNERHRSSGCCGHAVGQRKIISKGVIPIPKSTTISHLKENLEAQNIVLDEEDMKKIEGISEEKRFQKPPIFAVEWDK